ncbi:MAG: alpha/beta fold hydrolase [Planctomycetaceae bacterium]|nr:alpha/beta fold hydrolase [Planctomycetaceae bacterium]
MPQPAHLDPSPFYLAGGPEAVLLLHGYTGAPPEMRLIGEYLHSHGLTVAAPLLPGHGLDAADLNRRRWQEWTEHAARALHDLAAKHARVFVGGLSLGSLVALYLAAQTPQITGVIAYSPAVWPRDRRIVLTPLAKYLLDATPRSHAPDLHDPAAIRHLWYYDMIPVAAAHEVYKLSRQVRDLLPRLHCPLLVIHSTGDQAIHPESAQRTYDRAAAADKTLITLHDCGHCLTVDQEWEKAAAATLAFIRRLSPAGS